MKYNSVNNNIITLLEHYFELPVHEISQHLNLSKQYIHRCLNQLLDEHIIIKLGKAPLTYYRLNTIVEEPKQHYFTSEQEKFLLLQFLVITETGTKLEGIPAFIHWCAKQKLPVEKTLAEFMNTRNKYLAYYGANGLIDGSQKIKDTKGFDKINIDKLFYLDFYAIERFGKTRLGTLMHFAKQGQNKHLMAQIVSEIKDKIIKFILKNKIDAVLFVPPTIKRELQIINYLKKYLGIPCFDINIKKIHGEIAIPQKALSKIEDRIANAKMSFVIPEKMIFKKILIIDDAVGSGATINEIAGKLRMKKMAKTIYGIAITGSFKGFDVINEL